METYLHSHLFLITLFLEPHRNRQQRVKSVNWEAKDELEKSLGQEIAFYDWIRNRLDTQVKQIVKTYSFILVNVLFEINKQSQNKVLLLECFEYPCCSCIVKSS